MVRTSGQRFFFPIAITAFVGLSACSNLLGDFTTESADASIDSAAPEAGTDGVTAAPDSPAAEAGPVADAVSDSASTADVAVDATVLADATIVADATLPSDGALDAVATGDVKILVDAASEATTLADAGPDGAADSCAPETDAAFCARLAKGCGTVTAPDNCGTSRTVASCGTCTLPETCGASTPNQCACAAESDASFCARLGHTCGALAGADNCGKARTVASCGTCLATNSCSAAGICVCGNYAGCAAGQTCCSNGCFNVGSDPNNCAGCGMSCGPGDAWECYAGQCGCGIRGNGNMCGAACDNFETNSNCSGCGDLCDVVGGDLCCTLQGGTVYACRYGGDCAR
ncbi:MAG: hypothetical protein WBY94_06580 [Polyangiaceae bacterium]